MNRAVLVCHCLLDPLTRAQGTKKVSRDIISVLIQKDVGIIQLPCPEITYGLPVDRPPKNKEDYDTPEYREHCRSIARNIIAVFSTDQYHTAPSKMTIKCIIGNIYVVTHIYSVITRPHMDAVTKKPPSC